ncbi:MAG TPA: hypothetical protein VFP27_17355 [Mycobacterium sp.]|nr:hypothetical protein [Mycobacterium sp.]
MTDRILAGNIAIYLADERPTDGVTLVGEAQPGSLYIDRVERGIYINTFARNIPTWTELAPGLLHQATVTLTDAQIKALPTTPVELIAAPGANRYLVPVVSKMQVTLNWVANYTNIAQDSGLNLILSDGAAFSWDVVFSEGGNEMLLAWGASITWQVNESEVLSTTGTGNNADTLLNGALTLKIGPSAPSDLTGGHADNTLDVSLLYYVFDVVQKQFVHL